MSGNERRQNMLAMLQNTDTAISGKKLGETFGVSRQIIVQDIALLRREGHMIASTPRGYLIQGNGKCTRVLKVCHTEAQVEDELQTIIDLGGTVVNVMVNHRTYGKVCAPLNLKCRRDIQRFVEDLKTSKSSLLSNVTSGYHFHTIEAENTDILDEIEQALKDKNYLVDLLDYEKTFES